MHVCVRDTGAYLLDLQLRIPFSFGTAMLTELPHLFFTAAVEVDGRTHRGMTAEHLSPLWFQKDVTFQEGIENTVSVIEAAREAAERVEGESAFDLWRNLSGEQQEWGRDTDYSPLLWNFGVTLVERAVIDAVCRALETTVAEALRDSRLGFKPGAIYGELSGQRLSDLLPRTPQSSVAVRHTVGYADPLTDDDLASADRLDDGLPRTLEEYVEAYDLTRFKIVLQGNEDRDVERLRRIAGVLADAPIDDYAFSLDAGEQYPEIETFQRVWERLSSDPGFGSFLENLLFVEQPLPRERTFAPDTCEALSGWTDRPPIVIDEADDRVDRLREALECGYAGTTFKSCKGVFKGVANACLIAYRRQQRDGGEVIFSAEDLSTVGPISQLQDLAVVASLGLDHVQRNGYHYFRGLSMFPEGIQQELLAEHGDLYRHHDDGFPVLDIRDGQISTQSVTAAPFGYRGEFDVEQFTPIESWTFDGTA